jgi:hypothetical protein
MTGAANTARMSASNPRRPRAVPPLASYVLRVTGRPAVLSFELHDVRTGEHHRFSRAEALTAFLREHGLLDDGGAAQEPSTSGSQG